MNVDRYARQKLFPPIQEKGHEMLTRSTVLVVGAGALGTVICNHLVRSGVGTIRLIDRDYVELSNLQRQILFDEEDVHDSRPKSIAAKKKLEKINSTVSIEAIVGNATDDNIEELTDNVDVVMDGTDNFSTRYLLNDICYKRGIPFSYGGVVSSRGMTAFFIPQQTPCLRCIVKEGADNGQTCDTIGVISPAVDIVSSLQVTETMKYLTGNQHCLRNTLRTFDVWLNQQYDMKFRKPNPECPTCQLKVFPALETKAVDNHTILCGRNTVQIHEKTIIDLHQWESRLAKVSKVQRTPFLLKAIFDPIQFVLFPDGRVLVQGTEDPVRARSWYDRYIGS